jgi:hypothetical protein
MKNLSNIKTWGLKQAVSEKSNLIIGTGNGALGDALWLTPIFKAFPDATLQVVDNKHCWNLIQVYSGIVKNIKFSNDSIKVPTVNGKFHVIKNAMHALGAFNHSIIPWVKIYPEEIDWARSFLSQFGDLEKMVVITAHNSGGKDPNNFFARAIKPPKEIMQAYADVYNEKGMHPFQFANKPNHFKDGYDNFEPLENTTKIRGLSIRETAACYSLIKRMISGDTGDAHLMIAAGGKVIKMLGPEIGDYHHYDIQYSNSDWGNDEIREKYFKFEDWQNVLEFIDFKW